MQRKCLKKKKQYQPFFHTLQWIGGIWIFVQCFRTLQSSNFYSSYGSLRDNRKIVVQCRCMGNCKVFPIPYVKLLLINRLKCPQAIQNSQSILRGLVTPLPHSMKTDKKHKNYLPNLILYIADTIASLSSHKHCGSPLQNVTNLQLQAPLLFFLTPTLIMYKVA